MRALVLRLRKIPRPASRSEPSRLSSRTTSEVSSSSALLACFLVIPTLSDKWVATCDCVIIHLLKSTVLHCPVHFEVNPRCRIFKFLSSFFAYGKRVFEQAHQLGVVPQGFLAADGRISLALLPFLEVAGRLRKASDFYASPGEPGANRPDRPRLPTLSHQRRWTNTCG